MVPKWSNNGPKVVQKWSTNGQKSPKNGSKVVQNGSKMVQQWSQSGPNMNQNGPEMVQEWCKLVAGPSRSLDARGASSFGTRPTKARLSTGAECDAAASLWRVSGAPPAPSSRHTHVRRHHRGSPTRSIQHVNRPKSNGQKQPEIVKNGQKWSTNCQEMVRHGQTWSKNGQTNGRTMSTYVQQWSKMAKLVKQWSNMLKRWPKMFKNGQKMVKHGQRMTSTCGA